MATFAAFQMMGGSSQILFGLYRKAGKLRRSPSPPQLIPFEGADVPEIISQTRNKNQKTFLMSKDRKENRFTRKETVFLRNISCKNAAIYYLFGG